MKVTDEMVNRFLSWKLPEDFHPDAGISFSPLFNVEYNAKLGIPPARHQPIGTNLFNADQARAMLEHVLAPAPEEQAHNDEWNSAIDAAARTAMDMPLTSGEERHEYRVSNTYKTAALEISGAIRALSRLAMNSGPT